MKQLTVLLRDQGTAVYVGKQMQELFAGLAQVQVVTAGPRLQEGSVTGDVVVISRQMEKLKRYVRPGTPVLVAERSVNPDQVRPLFAIPPGSRVLVVNTTRELTEETIRQMELYGVEGLTYYPYYPGIGDYRQDCPYVITFGEMGAVPPGNYRQVTDLHGRALSVEACVLIARALGLYEQLRGRFATEHIRPLIQLTQDLAELHTKYAHTSADLQKIIDRMEDGVLVLDRNMETVFVNPMARNVLGCVEDGTALIRDQVRAHQGQEHFFCRIGAESYYVELLPSPAAGSGSTIVMLRDVKKIERIESSYRQTLGEKGLTAEHSFGDIVYHSEKMEELIQTARGFAAGNSTVFLHGESGSGKELMAQAIHNASPRRNQAFVAVNFASISLSLSESELFGYADGAFTGARRGGKKGLFELAHKGTIFLDEIGDAPIELQKKLLRVLQERKVLPVGGSRMVPVDVRIIAASNQDMEEMVKRGEFREDLYYRLNVLPLHIPPLRQRREDILPLFDVFLRKFGVNKTLPGEMVQEIQGYDWPGNVRELRNAAEYLSNFSVSDPQWSRRLTDLLYPKGRKKEEPTGKEERDAPQSVRAVLELLDRPPYRFSRKEIARDLEEQYGVALTESQVKGLVGRMKEAGLINAVTGRGTFLQSRGRNLLQRYRAGEK